MPGRDIARPRYRDDDGSADPGAAAALAAYAAGQGSEHAALTALAQARLLVPVVAVLTEAADPAGPPAGRAGPGKAAPPAREPGLVPDGEPAGGTGAGQAPHAPRLRREKTSEMALPTMVGKDGRHAVLAFTCLDSLTRWRGDARPVPVAAHQVWQAGAEHASAVVIDIAGPVPLAVDGARLAALASGQPPPAPHEDEDLAEIARGTLSQEPLLAGYRLLPGSAGSDLTLQLSVRAAAGTGQQAGQQQAVQQQAVQEAVQRCATSLIAGAGGRLRRGIAVTLASGEDLTAPAGSRQ